HSIDNVGSTSFKPPDGAPPGPSVRVRATTLDAYVRSHRLRRVDLVKIDVEGAELEVLAGAARTLDANPEIVLVVEFLRENARRFGHTVEDIEARLRAAGFRLYSLMPEGLTPYTPVGEGMVNVVATRRFETLLRGLSPLNAARVLLRLTPSTNRSAGPDDRNREVSHRRSTASSLSAGAVVRVAASTRAR